MELASLNQDQQATVVACLLFAMTSGVNGASVHFLHERLHWPLQGEVAEKEREAKSTKKLQEIASTARDEARTKAAKAVREYEKAFARANPMAAVMVSRPTRGIE